MEKQYGRKITPNHVLWPYLVELSSWLTARHPVRVDGRTAHFGASGCEYKGDVIPAGEIVLAKIATSSNRKQKGRKLYHKGDTTWIHGIWIGKVESNDEHLILTRFGEMKAKDSGADVSLFDDVCGAPGN